MNSKVYRATFLGIFNPTEVTGSGQELVYYKQTNSLPVKFPNWGNDTVISIDVSSKYVALALWSGGEAVLSLDSKYLTWDVHS